MSSYAGRVNARVVANRDALDAIHLGLVDAMLALGQRILDDSEKRIHSITGRLAASGGMVVLANGRKVGGNGSKPKYTPSRGLVLVVGYGAPHAHLVEFGTAKRSARLHTFSKGTRKGQTVNLRAHAATRARPFLTPAMMANIRGFPDDIRAASQSRLHRASRR